MPQRKALDEFARQQVADRDELSRVRARLTRTEKELLDTRRRLQLVETVRQADTRVPFWVRNQDTKHPDAVTACLGLSDLHLDEVVDPAQVDGYNAYDRDIAQLRLEQVGQRTLKLLDHYVAGVDIKGLVIFSLGDLLSGLIHEELRETNVGTVMQAVVYWVPQLAALLELLAEDYRVHLVGVTGNHDRNTRKPVHKNRAQDSFDWIIYHWLADHFKGDPRITIQISDSPDARVDVQGTQFLATHGDQFRGGSGIAGSLSPLLLGQHRKTRRDVAYQRAGLGPAFDHLVMGHFHQYFAGKGLIMSGTMKGYDEYAYNNNFEPEPPSQALWIVSPRHGVTMHMPVLPADKKKEGW